MSGETPIQVFEVDEGGAGPAPALGPAVSGAFGALGGTWIPSRFNVSVDLPRRRKAVYNTFTGALAVLDRRSWRRCLAPASEHRISGGAVHEALRTLQARGLLVSKGADEVEGVRLHYQASRFGSDTLSATMLCTLSCNLRCPYCFEGESQADGSRKTMSAETEEAAVSCLDRLSRGKRGLTVWWFGGEPLLALGSMERISARLKKACRRGGLRYGAMLATNGTLLTREVVDRLVDWNVASVQVTVDVPRAAKRDPQGRDTLDGVLDNVRGVAGRIGVHLRVNLSRDDEAEFRGLYRALIRRKLHRVPTLTMGIAHVFSPERGRSGCTVCPVANRSYVRVLARERARAAALGLPLKRFFLSSRLGCCSATCEAATVVGPDGLLYKCVEDVGFEDRAYGSVFLEGHVKPANLFPWLTYDWFGHDMCRGCPVLPQCAGGCPHRRMYQSRALRGEDLCYWDVRGDLEGRIREFARRAAGGGPPIA